MTVSETDERPILTCVADVEAQPVHWLWPGYLALGKLSLIAGNPDLGKSQFTAYLAAKVTTGGAWPCDVGRAEVGSVIILSAEDDLADTIRPRLEVAGAAVDRVHVLEAVQKRDGVGRRGFNLANDISQLESAILSLGDVRLVTVDPITAYLGTTDSHRTSDVRGVLAPLQELAAKHGTAVVAVSHLNKSPGANALMRVTGSLAFVGAARATFLITREPATNRRLFLRVKNNICKDLAGLAFEIEEKSTAGGIKAPAIVWSQQPVTITADQALMALTDTSDKQSALAEAKGFLCQILADGPLSAVTVTERAIEAGIKEKTLRRAREALAIAPKRVGGSAGHWAWALPVVAKATVASDETVGEGILEVDGHVRAVDSSHYPQERELHNGLNAQSSGQENFKGEEGYQL